MVRMDETAEASLAEILARSRLGIAMAAMIRMMATTINNSMREKPLACLERFIRNPCLLLKFSASGPKPRPTAVSGNSRIDTCCNLMARAALKAKNNLSTDKERAKRKNLRQNCGLSGDSLSASPRAAQGSAQNALAVSGKAQIAGARLDHFRPHLLVCQSVGANQAKTRKFPPQPLHFRPRNQFQINNQNVRPVLGDRRFSFSQVAR